MTHKAALLDNAKNMFGAPITDDARARINAFLAAPSFETWDECYTVLVTPRKTVWQAVIHVAPEYGTGITKPYKWAPGKDVPPAKRWSRFPDPLTVARGIRAVTNGGAR